MTTELHARLYGKIIEIKKNVSRKKLHRPNQGPNFLGDSFSNRNIVKAIIKFRRERQPYHLKR